MNRGTIPIGQLLRELAPSKFYKARDTCYNGLNPNRMLLRKNNASLMGKVPPLTGIALHDTMSDMKMTTRAFSRQLAKAKRAAAKGQPVEITDQDTGEVFIFSLKRKEKWQFASDAIGMIEAPTDLSERKGLSG